METKEAQTEILRLASLIAHQLQAPISAVSTILRTLGGEFTGALSAEQKDLIGRAGARCDEGVATVRRMLAIVSAMSGQSGTGDVTDLAAVLSRSQMRYQQRALERGLDLKVEIQAEPAYVPGAEEALSEVIDVLVDNALKYTPNHGRIRLTISADPSGQRVRLSVADSGVGIPQALREKVFEPFFRTPAAHQSSRPGMGLGLSFAKAVVMQVGGKISAGKADLGGAEIVVDLPAAQSADLAKMEEAHRNHSMRVVVVGGVAAGLKAASKIIRLKPDADVTVVERDEYLSYAGCGLPYYISGLIKEDELMSTPVGIVRDAVFFQSVKNVHVLTRTEAMEIDRAGKRVRVQDRKTGGEESWLAYDKLVLATGASPVVPSLPGIKLGNIFTLHGVRDAEGIKAALSRGRAHDVVIVGGGLIGMETTEALATSGCRVTIVEMLPQTLHILDAEMARLVELHLESKGVKVLTGTKVLSFEGQEKVQTVVTERGPIPADLVIMGIGVRPNVKLAARRGWKLVQPAPSR